MESIYNFTLTELKERLVFQGFPAYTAKQVFGWIYNKGIENFAAMTNLSQATRNFLKENFYFSHLKLIKREISSDKSEKFLLGLEDGNSIETVFIPENSRNTLCVSTQVGCKFKCAFCASGQAGFKRNLEFSEILGQYLEVSKLIAPLKITNIVFMGIGEPLDNFSNTVKAIEILTEPQGLDFSKRKICISTCGLGPEIKKLADLDLGIKLSISLHSPDNGKRTELMPVNKKYPLNDLIKAVRYFYQKQKYPVTFEYVLLGGYNTNKEDAQMLAKLLKNMSCKINLIPLNCILGGFRPASEQEIDSFRAELKKKNLFSILRKSRGQDINAACGQLRAGYNCIA